MGKRNNQSADQRANSYEIPTGVIVQENGDESSLRVRSSRNPGLVFMHIQINKSDGRKFYQSIELNPKMARAVARKIIEIADAVEGAGNE